ncbi:MAG: tetratricopeptide repeat protein, partial [Rudaea sp.]
MNSKPSFFAELKRRNVLRAAALYIGAAWALAQGTAQLLPVFDFPNWVVRWFVIAAMIGFPLAMLFSWFYEWTPHGIQRESEIETDASVTRTTGKKMDRWIIAVLGLAVVLLLTNQFVVHRDTATTAAPTIAPRKSIAVLPFENLSDDKGNVYFSDGITEEILDALTQIPNLKVAARSSAFQFKGDDLNLHNIGQTLGVANILEGSVQKAGDQVRINVQLVDIQSGLQLWSEKYDRKLDNVFAVEDDIARSIATQLRVQLTGGSGQPLIADGTGNPQAHELYLRGLTLIAQRGPGLRDAVAAFQHAVTLDPEYAAAWGELAQAEMLLPGYRLGSVESTVARGEAAAQRALAIDPNTASAQVALGEVYESRFQWRQAGRAFQRALALAPGDAEAVNQYAQFLSQTGQHESALQEIERAKQIDPLSPINDVIRAGLLAALHRDDAALAQVESLLTTYPDFYPAHVVATLLYIDLHRYTDAEVQLRAIARMVGVDPEAKAILARGMADPTQRVAALKSLNTSPANADLRDDPIWYALYLTALGEHGRALDQLEIFAVKRNSIFSTFLVERAFDPLRSDPRFKAV